MSKRRFNTVTRKIRFNNTKPHPMLISFGKIPDGKGME